MDNMFYAQGKTRCKAQEMKNLNHYCVELFYAIIDMQLQELDNCFTESNTKLILCVSCLSLSDPFVTFDK